MDDRSEREAAIHHPDGADGEAEDREADRLVARAQEGDSDAFGALYSLYFDRVYAYLRTVLHDVHDTEDATQQVFADVLEALPRFEPRRPFRAWLFVVVRNHALKALEQRGRLDVMDPEEIDRLRELTVEDDPPRLGALGWITDPDLFLFVERLPVAQRQVLLLRYLLDLDSNAIAEVLDRTPGDVRKLQSRAIVFLRERLIAVHRKREARGDGEAERRDRAVTRPVQQATVLRARRFMLNGW